jgi:hypothetical protein
MATLTIDNDKARKIYPTASSEIKTILEQSFGKDFFSQKITDRVKTFEDACEVVGIIPDLIELDGDTLDEIAYKKLKVIVKALNEGWIPDWKDTNQYKYYPWFYMDKTHSSSGFSFFFVGYYCTGSYVGSRLCFKSAALAEYAAKQFTGIYKEFFTL